MNKFNICKNDRVQSQGENVPLNYIYGKMTDGNNLIYYMINPDKITETSHGYNVPSMYLYDFKRHNWTQISPRSQEHKRAFRIVRRYVCECLEKHNLLYTCKNKNHISTPDKSIFPREKRPQKFERRMKPDTGGNITDNLKYKQVTEQAYWLNRGNASIVANGCRYN